MTREEAIEVLKDIYNYTRFDTYTTNEARTMAIEALKQEPIYYPPCQDCHTKMDEIVRAYDNVKSLDDAVSRQAVLKINENYHGKMPNHINFEIWNEIKALPPVLPKREGNTVSEEVYTEEYTRRKALEYENYVLKQNMQALK